MAPACRIVISHELCEEIEFIAKQTGRTPDDIVDTALRAGLGLFHANDEEEAGYVYRKYFEDDDGRDAPWFI